MKPEDESMVGTAEMKFIRWSAKYTWESFKMNEDIMDWIRSEFPQNRQIIHIHLQPGQKQHTAQVQLSSQNV
jgi:hypothetical protein